MGSIRDLMRCMPNNMSYYELPSGKLTVCHGNHHFLYCRQIIELNGLFSTTTLVSLLENILFLAYEYMDNYGHCISVHIYTLLGIFV